MTPPLVVYKRKHSLEMQGFLRMEQATIAHVGDAGMSPRLNSCYGCFFLFT